MRIALLVLGIASSGAIAQSEPVAPEPANAPAPAAAAAGDDIEDQEIVVEGEVPKEKRRVCETRVQTGSIMPSGCAELSRKPKKSWRRRMRRWSGSAATAKARARPGDQRRRRALRSGERCALAAPPLDGERGRANCASSSNNGQEIRHSRAMDPKFVTTSADLRTLLDRNHASKRNCTVQSQRESLGRPAQATSRPQTRIRRLVTLAEDSACGLKIAGVDIARRRKPD
jgi:hypothetical protein